MISIDKKVDRVSDAIGRPTPMFSRINLLFSREHKIARLCVLARSTPMHARGCAAEFGTA